MTRDPERPTQSPAEIVEKLFLRTGVGTALLAISFTIAAVRPFVAERLDLWLDRSQMGLSIAVLVIVGPAFARFFILRMRNRDACQDAEGFITDAYLRAAGMSFSLGFVFLLGAGVAADKWLSTLPAAFFIDVAMAFMLGVFSIAFILNNLPHQADDTDLDEEAVE